jgi:hypothetical protein
MWPSCVLAISRPKAAPSSCLCSDKFFSGVTFDVELTVGWLSQSVE